jgi:hypothetical protein
MAIISFHSAYNFLISGKIFYLIILLTSLVLGISFKAYFWGFAIPFLALLILLNLKQFYCFIINIKTKFNKSYIPLVFLLILNVTCLTMFHFNNYFEYGGFFGDFKLTTYHVQPDSFKGGAINGFRYIIQSLSLPKSFGGKYVDNFLSTVLSEDITLGATKGTKPEQVKIGASSFPIPREDWSWYGPLGFFLLIPSVIFTIVKGNNFLKALSLSLLCFYSLICYKIGWMPWNNRFFSLFFAGSVVCSAFLLRSIFRRFYKYLLILSFITFSYAAFFNNAKPLINLDNLYIYINNNVIHFTKNIDYINNCNYNWIYFVFHRNAYFERYFGDDRIDLFYKSLESGKKLLIISDVGFFNTYSYLIRRPDIKKTVTNSQMFYYEGKSYNLTDNNDYKNIKIKFDYILLIMAKPFRNMNSERLIFKYASERTESCFLYKITE